MRKGIGGLVIGMLLGSAMPGAAQGAWQSAAHILSLSPKHNDAAVVFQTAYIEGMDDALRTIQALSNSYPNTAVNNEAVLDAVLQHVICLHTHARGTAEQFARWASGVWQAAVDAGHGDANAASVLIDDACK